MTESDSTNTHWRQRRQRGEWWYAGLCVECPVCGSVIGSLCMSSKGNEMRGKHHYNRYRDVRKLLGLELPGYSVPGTPIREGTESPNELVKAG